MIYISKPNLVHIFIVSNLLNSCIISTKIDNQSCLKMWKLSWVDCLGSTKTKIQVQSLSTKTLKPIRRCFGLGFCPSWINPTGPCDFEQSNTRTTALTQKGCVSCVNNGKGGYTCGPHGFLSVQRAIGAVLSAFDYWC